MPQMNRGGKFIFGVSVIGRDGLVQLPPQVVEEYSIAAEGRVYLFTGSRSTGGFCVTRRGLLLPSKLGHILTETPELLNYAAPAGRFIPYKGRAYCWVEISEGGAVRLTGKCWPFCILRPECGFFPSAAATSPSRWAQRGRFWRGRRALTARYPCFDLKNRVQNA